MAQDSISVAANDQAMVSANSSSDLTIQCPQKRITFSDLVQTFGTGSFIKVCTIVVGIILARALGAAGRGAFEAAHLWPVLFASLGNLGVYIAIKRLAAKEMYIGPVASAAIVLSVVLSGLTMVCGYFLLPYLIPHAQHDLLPVAVLFLLYIPANHVAMNLGALDEGTGNFGRYNLIRSILSPVWLFFTLVLWAFGSLSVKGALAALLISNFVVVAIRLWITLRSYMVVRSIYSPVKVLRNGIPFWLAGVCDLVYQTIDRAVIMWLLGPRELGLYMVALAPSGLIQSTMADSTNTVVFAMSAQSDDGTGFKRSASVFRVTALVWLVAGILLALSIPFIIPFVYGAGFREAILPGIVLIGGSALGMQGCLLNACLMGQGRPFAGVMGRLISAPVFVITALWLAKDWGLMGMGTAFILGQALYFSILLCRIAILHGRGGLESLLPKPVDFNYAWTRALGFIRCIHPADPREE